MTKSVWTKTTNVFQRRVKIEKKHTEIESCDFETNLNVQVEYSLERLLSIRGGIPTTFLGFKGTLKV